MKTLTTVFITAGTMVMLFGAFLFVQNKILLGKGMKLAEQSFGIGCLTEGNEMCNNQFHGTSQYNENFKSLCLQFVLEDCGKKTENFVEWMDRERLKKGL